MVGGRVLGLFVLAAGLGSVFFLISGSPVDDSSQSKDSLTHVIIPFVPKQRANLMRMVRLWELFLPCPLAKLESYSRRPSLVFFVASQSKVDDDFKKEIISGIPEVSRKCFADVEWVEELLSPSEDVYPIGPNVMFGKMLRFTNEAKYGYIFYMEPDVRPIRSGWLTKLSHACAWPNSFFWMKGSVFRGMEPWFRAFIEKKADRLSILLHINGNAIYNVRDNEFRSFYFQKVLPFNGKKLNGYDQAFFDYLFYSGNTRDLARFHHLFKSDDFIQNMWHTKYDLKTFTRHFPETFLIHGGLSV